MAARARARSRSAVLAIALATGWTACGHDTLRLLPAGEEGPLDAGDNEPLDSGTTVGDMLVDAGVDVGDNDSGSGDFGGRSDGFGGSSNDPPSGFGGGTTQDGAQGGAPNCESELCGPCHPDDIDCWRCLYVTCDFRPWECLDEWQAKGCAMCSEAIPCGIVGQSCHLPTNQCLPSCQRNEDCPIGRKCDVEDGVCVECLGQSDCCPPGDIDCDRVCHLGKCFQCGRDTDCRQDEICVQGGCVECLHDGMCPPDWPHCSLGSCRECVRSSDCGPGQTCNSQLGFCY